MGVQIVNQYNDASRGVFQDASLAKQLVSFEGLKFRGRNGVCNVTPTDIDGLVQLDKEKCFIFFELKHSGAVPYGQATALAKLADFVQAGGSKLRRLRCRTQHTARTDNHGKGCHCPRHLLEGQMVFRTQKANIARNSAELR